MKKVPFLSIFLFSFSYQLGWAQSAEPLRLHPQNPHYFEYKGKPLVLITSAEHYGAVLNEEFDFQTYLATLKEEGMNYTRIFTGSYVEVPGAFGIGKNTLAPAVGRYLCPWKRTEEEGLFEGEKKVDLSRWNPKYFERLRAFVEMAQDYDIMVELTFFCSTYNDGNWERNVFNPQNNVNNLPEGLDRIKSNTEANGDLLNFQKALLIKIVRELNLFDNIFYEIQNEPWADDPQKVMRTLRTLDPMPGQSNWFKWAEEASPASLSWQKVMTQVIVDTEKELLQTHLIAQNYTNFKHSLTEVDSNISILNFHYVWPEAVRMNYGWDRPVSFDESGFAGSSDSTYLRQAWQFMLAGGAVFNNLDYSFYVGAEEGTGKNEAPGGGSTRLRKQLTFLRTFMESLDFVAMKPDYNCVYQAPGLEWQALSERGEQYGLVFHGSSNDGIRMDLPKGKYTYMWVSPYTGLVIDKGEWSSEGKGAQRMGIPKFEGLMALRIEADK